MSVPNEQLYQLSSLYVDNLILSVTSSTTLTLGSGAARDSTNSVDIVLEDSILIDTDIVGAGGIDTGSLAPNSWYYIYVIGSSLNQKQPSALVSLSATAPQLPLGYDCYRRVGVALTTSPTAFIILWQEGTGKNRKYTIESSSPVLNAGQQTTFTAFSLINGVPPLNSTTVTMTYSFSVETANNTFSLNTGASGSSNSTVVINNTTTSHPVRGEIEMVATLVNNLPTMKYKVTQSGDELSLSVIAFNDYL
jgi:hypothetical protein